MPTALITAPGSRGDVNPMLAIAKELRQRDWKVHVALSEPYAKLVEALDCNAEVVVSTDDFHQMLNDERLWDSWHGPRIIFQQAVSGFCDAYQPRLHALLERSRATNEETVLIAHPLDFVSRIYRDLNPDLALVNVHLAPSTLYTPQRPPKLSDMAWEVRRPAWLAGTVYGFADRMLIQRWMRPALARTATALGGKIRHRSLIRWWTMPDAIIGFFPEWFGPGSTYLPGVEQVGFPLYDGPEQANGAASVEELLRGLDSPPLAFTAGTAHAHSKEYFQTIVELCERNRWPAILLSSQPDQMPGDLPDWVRPARYVSFAELLPRCRAFVHHGGIGSTSQGFAAGIPQLILPMAFDQFDNAERMSSLGCGLSCSMRKLTPGGLEQRLRQILADESYASRAAEIAKRCDAATTMQQAVKVIETVLRGKNPSRPIHHLPK